MPVVRISDETFGRLQKVAIPLEDTIDSVIARVLDEYEGAKSQSSQPSTQQIQSPKELTSASDRTMPNKLDPNRPPSLTHTRVLDAKFGDKSCKKWNGILRVANEMAYQQAGDFKTFQGMTRTNVVEGEKNIQGFRPLDDAPFSMQYKPATDSWLDILHLAKRLGVRVYVHFEWRDKPGAARRGQEAVLEWNPS